MPTPWESVRDALLAVGAGFEAPDMVTINLLSDHNEVLQTTYLEAESIGPGMEVLKVWSPILPIEAIFDSQYVLTRWGNIKVGSVGTIMDGDSNILLCLKADFLAQAVSSSDPKSIGLYMQIINRTVYYEIRPDLLERMRSTSPI